MEFNFSDIPTLLLTLGVGGIIGAAASAIVASSRLKSEFESFRETFRAYIIGKDDPASREVESRFASLESVVDAATSAIGRLKRSLRRK